VIQTTWADVLNRAGLGMEVMHDATLTNFPLDLASAEAHPCGFDHRLSIGLIAAEFNPWFGLQPCLHLKPPHCRGGLFCRLLANGH